MSEDVDRLLDQLGQPDLPYRTFADKVETPGFWPIFRLVVGHPALSRLPGARRRSAYADPVAPAGKQADEWPGADRRVGGPGELFRRYGEQPAPAPAEPEAPAEAQDIRALLRRLSN